MEHLRATLIWRLRMHALLQPDDTPEDICAVLPPSAMDVSDRPVAVVKASKLASLSCSDHAKRSLLRVAETLRLHTLYTNLASDSSSHETRRLVLQVAMILDVANVSVYAFVRLSIYHTIHTMLTRSSLGCGAPPMVHQRCVSSLSRPGRT